MSQVTINSVVYTLNAENNTASVTGRNSPPSNWDLVIPSTITVSSVEYTVTSIGDSAFYDVSVLKSVIIPNSVKTIGFISFLLCINLTTINLGNGVETILPGAFAICIGLTGTLTIPNSVKTIDAYAFADCSKLTSLNLGSGVQTLGESCFGSVDFFPDAAFTNIYFQSPTTPLTTLGSNLFVKPLSPLTVTYYYAPNGETDLNSQMVTLKNTYFPANTTTFIYLASCFAEGTKILCLENNEEKWVNVEELKINTLVKTYLHGYKAIKCMGESKIMNHPSDKSFRMYKMSKLEHLELTEDLILTADHSILVDTPTIAEKRAMKKLGFHETIDDKQLVLASESSKFKKIMEMKEYNVFNFALESETGDQRYGVYANGILCETPSMNSIKKKKHEFVEFWEE
jgi:hypothetical protein